MSQSSCGLAVLAALCVAVAGCGGETTPTDGGTGGMDGGGGGTDGGASGGDGGGGDTDGGGGGTDGGGGDGGGGGTDGGGGGDDGGGGGTDGGGGGTDAGAPPTDAGTGGPCGGAGDCAHLNRGAHCAGDDLVETVGLCVMGTCMAIDRRLEDCTATTEPGTCDGDTIVANTGYCDARANACRMMNRRTPCDMGICAAGPPVTYTPAERCRIGFGGAVCGATPTQTCLASPAECQSIYFHRVHTAACDPTTGCRVDTTTTDCRDRVGASCDASDATRMSLRSNCVCNTASRDGCTCSSTRDITCGTALTACVDATRLLDCTAASAAFCIADSGGSGGLCSNCVITTCSTACVSGAGGSGTCT